ncbi:F-box and associated interaction domains-containing protein [Striga asiatica]|uniref:F-box and associated interaction domains-containing protein n=1 Tax=Striga asiatica TaxID=4170 RepID=A0A5A7R5S9_STRAF|nr:F-box and associated interaction domains-containing protein [Striga asiatica]
MEVERDQEPAVATNSPAGVRIWASTNSLVLGPSPSNPHTLRIVNPWTTEYLDLPPLFGGGRVLRHNLCLMYVAATNEYKVVQVQIAGGLRGSAVSYEYVVLTVGSDTSWRLVDHLSRETKALLSISNPLTTDGFVHWVPCSGGSTILTLDAETEVMTESRLPVPLGRWGESEFLVSGGKNLTLVVKKLGRSFSWDVWEMSPKTRVWRKTVSVDLEDERLEGFIRDRDEKLAFNTSYVRFFPVGWLNYPEVLVFAPSRGRYCMLYWVRTREIESIDLPKESYSYMAHQSGLVSPTGFESDQESAVATNSPAGVMASCNRTPICYFRRRFRSTNTESLSEDLLSNILLRLPTRDIHDSARLVCRRWAQLTRSRDFTLAHLRREGSGLLLQSIFSREDLIFISSSGPGRAETSRSRLELGRDPTGLRIWASSHGLVLVPSPSNPHSLRVVNPGTTEYLDLPPLCSGRRFLMHCICLMYVAATNEYKVVQVQIAGGLRSRAVSYECVVLTVGSDTSWRLVGTEDSLSRETKPLFSLSSPLTTDGFVHWVPWMGGSTILTLDAETEVMTESRLPVPLGRWGWGKNEFLLSGGKNLTLVVKKRGGSFLWDVWEMSPETRVWRKTVIVDLEEDERLEGFIRDRDEKVYFWDANDVRFFPVGWLNYPEVLVFAPSRGRYCMLYWVRTREIEPIDLPKGKYDYVAHQSGLIVDLEDERLQGFIRDRDEKKVAFLDANDVRFCPVGWLNYPEVLVFAPSRGQYCMLYWVGTREIESIDLPKESYNYTAHQSGLMASCNRTPIRLTNMESLSEDLLFNILIRLPAHDIHDSASLVCRRWAHLTRSRDFTLAHLRRAGTGLLLQSLTSLEGLTFISGGPGRAEPSRLRHESGLLIRASCHGLVLVTPSSNPYTSRIVNPVTTEYLDLPPLIDRRYSSGSFCLVYVGATDEYKVVQIRLKIDLRGAVAYECTVLTVGANTSWRHVGEEDLLSDDIIFSLANPLTTDGFVHLVPIPNRGGSTILAVDAETEVMTETRAPVPLGRERESEFLLSGGKNLTLVVKKLGGSFSWDVWEMSPETRVWRKTVIVDLEEDERLEEFIRDRDANDVRFCPVGWLNYPEVLVFAPSRGRYCMLYWVCTREIESVDLPEDAASLDARFLRPLLVGVLADDLRRVLGDAGDEAMAVEAVAGAVVEVLEDGGLVAGVAALEEYHRLVRLDEFHHFSFRFGGGSCAAVELCVAMLMVD